MRDVNDTGFKLVLGRADWREQFGVGATASGDPSAAVVYDAADRCATLRPITDRFPRRTADPTLRPADRSSAARDRYGSWYWIDPGAPSRIVVRNAGDEVVETFWPPESESPESEPDAGAFCPAQEAADEPSPTLGALTITVYHRLVVAVPSPAQLLVFDLHASGPPQRIPWRESKPFFPADATPRPDGGLYLLETPPSESPRIWALDRGLQSNGRPPAESSASSFRPVGAKDNPESSSPVPTSSEPTPVPAGAQRIEALPDDTVLVLSVTTDDEGEAIATVHRYRPLSTDEDSPVDAGHVALSDGLEPEGADETWAQWRAHDIAFVPGTPTPTQAVRGTLYVVGADGNQAYALHLIGDEARIDAEPKAQYIPLRRFSGKGLVESDGDVFYDDEDRWLPLTAQRRPRFVDRGQMHSAPFDSEIASCTWHRLFLDACIPPEADVRVESRASDRPDRLPEMAWQPEPDLYQRDTGAELPYYDAFPDTSDREGRGTWELLLQNAEGRYLQLRLTFEGNGRARPRVYALRAYYPRFSYLDEYLPDVYQEDEASAQFVERFLANVEGVLTDIEGKIAAVKALFDVRTVPDEYLDWLATWFGMSLDPALDTRRKRLFLDHAVELFNQRGTLSGMARMLTLALDPCADETLFTPAGIADAVGRPRDATDETARRESVRLVEEFTTRDVSRAAVGDARAPEQPAEVRVDQPWTYEDGAETLHRRFRSFLDRERYETADDREAVWGPRPSFPPLLPPPDAPNAEQRRADWQVFVRRVIEGPYAAIEEGDGSVAGRFRAFLQRRYRSRDTLPTAWVQGVPAFAEGTSLDAIGLPPELPSGAALRDWMHFVGTALPVHRSAHRFQVLVPVDPDTDISAQRQRLDVARRVVETQKPAHTAFEVLPYWAAFRVGTVRTGLDTVLGRGSRYSPLLVGDGALAENTVGVAHPQNVPDRRVVGRDSAASARPL